MSRRPRVWVPGGIYHVTVRGNNRDRMFLEDVDYQQYLVELRQHRDQWPFHVLAYALMPNHVHLVIEPSEEASFSDVMRQQGTRYAHYFNQRYRHIGHVHQGRFYSNWVNQEPYLLEVTRYVHLNPVRARLCARPIEYRWSSYRQYVSQERDPLGLVECGKILSLFGSTVERRRLAYQTFVEELAEHEDRIRSWCRHLQREKLIPPRRWLRETDKDDNKVTVTLTPEK